MASRARRKTTQTPDQSATGVALALTPTSGLARGLAQVTAAYAVVRFRMPGYHRWEGATVERAYLGQTHRHLFHVEVQLEVFHDDREVEYHDLLDYATQAYPGGDMGGWSCEMMARHVLDEVSRRFPGRRLSVSVFEDGEVGAVLEALETTLTSEG